MNASSQQLLMQAAQLPQEQSAQIFGALNGNAYMQAQLVDKGLLPSYFKSVQTSGSVGRERGYDVRDDALTIMQRAWQGPSRGFMRGDGQYSIGELASMTTVERENAMQKVQIQDREYNFALQNKQFARESALSTTGVGLGAMLGNAAFEGKGQYYFEDKSRALQRKQEDVSLAFSQKELQLQERGIGLQQSQFYENFNLSQARFAENSAYQRREMDIGHSQQRTQFSWQMQDFAYQRGMSQMQFGFNMIDMDEDIRYATGRQRRVAMRHRDQAVITQSMQMGHLNVEEGRAKTQQKWEEERFQREKTHFEAGVQFQKQEMDLQKKHFEENMAQTKSSFELQKQQFELRKQFIKEERTLEDEKRAVDRAAHAIDLQERKDLLKHTQDVKRTMDDLAGAAKIMNTQMTNLNAQKESAAQTGAALEAFRQAIIAAGRDASASMERINAFMEHGGRDHELSGSSGGTYANGGFTGYGGKYDAAGIVHKGEYVIPQEGSPVVMSPRVERLLENIHNELTGIHADGGNSIINLYGNGLNKAVNKTLDLYDKAFS